MRRNYVTSLVALLLSCPGRLAWQVVPSQRLMGGTRANCKNRRHNGSIGCAALSMSEDLMSSTTNAVSEPVLDPEVCEQFKILTCASTSCSQRRKVLGMDEFATVGALWGRKEDADAPGVEVEESPCLGRCKLAPCVAIEHEDYEGTVALEGMTQAEFSDRVFHNIITEEDCDRVWESVESAIRVMADETE